MEKYSEKFINQSNVLQHAVIGFEFEFYMNVGFTYFKTMDMLDKVLAPSQVYGFRMYHSPYNPIGKNFKLEPDISGGERMCELITSPLPYYVAKIYLVKMLKFIQENGYTTDKSSIHYNISFDDTCDRKLVDINSLKLILEIDEDEIYDKYPTRGNNVYAKSVKRIIPYKDYNYPNIPITTIRNNIKIPDDRYYGINFLHLIDNTENQRLEFRYIGGKDNEKNIGNILYFMDKFIINTYNSIDNIFTDEDNEKLESYLNNNITLFKNFTNYDNFIVEFPTILLQVNMDNTYEVVSSYYEDIYDMLFYLITSTINLKNCIINYITDSKCFEIVDADVKASTTLSNYNFVNSKTEGILKGCHIINSVLNNSQAFNCRFDMSDVNKSKIIECTVENSDLNDCYFLDGYLNGSMYGGVFRSGKLGECATLDSNVKIINNMDNFFNTSHNNLYRDIKNKIDKK